MKSDETITLEAVLGLAKKLSALEKLKLAEHVLVALEPMVGGKEPKRRRSLRRPLKGQTLTEEAIEEVKRKLWGTARVERPRRVVQLGGLWKDVPFDVSAEDIRQVRRELSEGLKRRATRL